MIRASDLCRHCGHEFGEHTPTCEKGMHTGRPCGCPLFASLLAAPTAGPDDEMVGWYAEQDCPVTPDRRDGLWALWNHYTDRGDWAWTVIASPDGVSHQNIWPGPKTAVEARALADALTSAAHWHEQVTA